MIDGEPQQRFRIDPIRGEIVERAIRETYGYLLKDRDLDEIDRELLEIVINETVILIVTDSALKHGMMLSERGKTAYINATRSLADALAALDLPDAYRSRPN